MCCDDDGDGDDEDVGDEGDGDDADDADGCPDCRADDALGTGAACGPLSPRDVAAGAVPDAPGAGMPSLCVPAAAPGPSVTDGRGPGPGGHSRNGALGPPDSPAAATIREPHSGTPAATASHRSRILRRPLGSAKTTRPSADRGDDAGPAGAVTPWTPAAPGSGCAVAVSPVAPVAGNSAVRGGAWAAANVPSISGPPRIAAVRRNTGVSGNAVGSPAAAPVAAPASRGAGGGYGWENGGGNAVPPGGPAARGDAPGPVDSGNSSSRPVIMSGCTAPEYAGRVPAGAETGG